MVGMLWRYAKEHIDGMDRLGPNPAAEVGAIHTEQQAYDPGIIPCLTSTPI
jgi:hypothetical protein